LHDAAHIALREQRLRIKLTKDPEPVRKDSKDPTGIFAELDQLLAKPASSQSSRKEEKKLLLTNDMTNTVDRIQSGIGRAQQIETTVPDYPERGPDLAAPELFEALDTFAGGESRFSHQSRNKLDACVNDVAGLLEKVQRTGAVLERDVEASTITVSEEPQETPAEFVARNPGKALEAARAVPKLFHEIDHILPKSKKKATSLLAQTGMLDVHADIEESLQDTLAKKDESHQWVQRVMTGTDKLSNYHANWSSRAFESLDQEKDKSWMMETTEN